MDTLFAKHNIIVSRETLDKLRVYEALLHKWQRAINLVSSATLAQAAQRHFLDSAQILPRLPGKDIILADLGAGAGFPGMVLAVLGVRDVHLVESDRRKAEFLRTVSRETETPVTVHDMRIEDCALPSPGIVTARALAPLDVLLDHMKRLGASCGLFLKGARAGEEIDQARARHDFAVQVFPSVTDPAARIVRVDLDAV